MWKNIIILYMKSSYMVSDMDDAYVGIVRILVHLLLPSHLKIGIATM